MVFSLFRLGVRAHDFGKLPPEELAAKIAASGATCVQLALSKAIDGIDNDYGRLSPGLANSIGESFRRHGIQIAVLGCYINLIHPDSDERRKLLERFKEHIRFARDFGCSIVGTETGSVNADYSFHPANHSESAFQTLLGSVDDLVNEAEKFGVFVGIEGVAKHVAHTPERVKRLLKVIPSHNLQVIFDPVNLLTPENHHDQDRIIQESFEYFGEKILILHAKDFMIEKEQLRTLPAGRGMLNYKLIARLLKEQKPYINILLEDTTPSDAPQSMAFIKSQ